MRYNLIDLLIAIAFIGIGSGLGGRFAHDWPHSLGFLIGSLIGACAYVAAACPIYRRFRFLPLVLPRCPCCHKLQDGFHFTRAWPRVNYRCPTCNGEFVIWHNGKVTDKETWDKPVLVLKWPYAFGRYKKMEKPDPPPTSKSG